MYLDNQTHLFGTGQERTRQLSMHLYQVGRHWIKDQNRCKKKRRVKIFAGKGGLAVDAPVSVATPRGRGQMTVARHIFRGCSCIFRTNFQFCEETLLTSLCYLLVGRVHKTAGSRHQSSFRGAKTSNKLGRMHSTVISRYQKYMVTLSVLIRWSKDYQVNLVKCSMQYCTCSLPN